MSPAEGAAHWTVLQDTRALTRSETTEFETWLEVPANADALRRAHSAMSLFDSASAGSDPNLRALRQAALDATPPRQFPFRLAGGGLAAASITALVVFAGVFQTSSPPGHVAPRSIAASSTPAVEPSNQTPTEYASGVGERRMVHLDDGTAITLNTRSRIQVAYTKDRRLVRLLRGQALFEVAHQPLRPFVVEAADRQVTALGTIFEVRLEPGSVNVLLVRGRVVVDRIPNANSQFVAATQPAILKPGEQFVAELGAPQKVATVDVTRQLLWRDGFVEFDNVSLGNAVAELNRYTNKPITLSGDGVSALHISGVYKTGAPDQFVDAVQGILPVTAKPTADGGLALSLVEKTK
ncbi:hypothetical protein AX777_20630 [Sphingobium yanoikuyae]|uniref:FecR protein domain-containing protein n=1 Tax=Sphingobium yanoikuyae TaxID=13690 RepID=A0A177JUW4_SPHYA|nr:hypothetical protein AX777_20630 [Sphingobium yanoikuyae]